MAISTESLDVRIFTVGQWRLACHVVSRSDKRIAKLRQVHGSDRVLVLGCICDN